MLIAAEIKKIASQVQRRRAGRTTSAFGGTLLGYWEKNGEGGGAAQAATAPDRAQLEELVIRKGISVETLKRALTKTRRYT